MMADLAPRRCRRATALTTATLLLLLPVLLVPPDAYADTAAACPDDVGIPAPSDDVAGTTHATAITCAMWWGVAAGRTDGSFGPGEPVLRAQMATFLVNAFAAAGSPLPASGQINFDDVEGVHADNIDRIAAVGITTGVGDGTSFAPNEPVQRGQMATFIERAFSHLTSSTLPAGPSAFGDTEGNVHEAAIDRIAHAGIAEGVAGDRFAPDQVVTRGQMARFLMRLFDLLVVDGQIELPADEPTDEPTEPDEEPALLDEPDPDPGPGSRLDPGDRLASGSNLVSRDGRFRLRMQTDGNLVLLNTDGSPAWATGTDGHPGAELSMQGDGNAVIYSTSRTPLWATGTDGNAGASLTLQSDRNIVLTSGGGTVLWASGTDISEPSGSGRPTARIDMPFTGYWDRFGYSPPSSHHTPFGGDWGTDIYANPGTTIRANVRSTNHTVQLRVIHVRPGCRSGSVADGGYEVRATVLSDGQDIGWVSWMHVANPAVSAGQTLSPGATLGVTSRFRTSDCYQVTTDAGTHVHLEARDNTNYACYVDHGAGTLLSAGTMVGKIGGSYATSTGAQCP